MAPSSAFASDNAAPAHPDVLQAVVDANQGPAMSYGDDAESDENYPIIRLTNATGTFYARTTDWSNTLVGSGTGPETVNFTLPAGINPGNYALIVSGAGLSGIPLFVSITASQIAGLPPSGGPSNDAAKR